MFISVKTYVKVMSDIILLFYFLNLKKNVIETRKNVFMSLQKFFLFLRYSNFLFQDLKFHHIDNLISKHNLVKIFSWLVYVVLQNYICSSKNSTKMFHGNSYLFYLFYLPIYLKLTMLKKILYTKIQIK